MLQQYNLFTQREPSATLLSLRNMMLTCLMKVCGVAHVTGGHRFVCLDRFWFKFSFAESVGKPTQPRSCAQPGKAVTAAGRDCASRFTVIAAVPKARLHT